MASMQKTQLEEGFDPLSMMMGLSPKTDSSHNNNNNNKKEDEFEGFSPLEQSYLKKLIIKGILNDELEYYKEHPKIESLLNETTLISFAYQKMWLKFPLFNLKHYTPEEKKKLKDSVDRILLFYPSFSRLHYRSNPLLIRRAGSTVDILDLRVQTSDECTVNQKVMDFIYQANRSPVDENKIDPQVKPILEELSVRRDMLYLMQILFKDIKEPQDVEKELFGPIKQAKSLRDLAPEFGRVFGLEGTAPILTFLFSQPGKKEKFRNIYNMIPIKTLETLFSVASPMKIVTDLMSLFLSRPLGAKSLFMRICEGLSDVPRTEREINELRKKLSNKEICEKIHNYMFSKYDASTREEPKGLKTKDFVLTILKDDSVKPPLDPSWVAKLNDEHLKALHLLVEKEAIYRAKVQMVDILGSEAFVGPLNDILSVVSPVLCFGIVGVASPRESVLRFDPQGLGSFIIVWACVHRLLRNFNSYFVQILLAMTPKGNAAGFTRVELSNNGDFKTLLGQVFKIWNSIITIAEKTNPEQDPTPLFAKELSTLEDSILPYFQAVLKGDQRQVIEQVFEWVTTFFQGKNPPIVVDLEKLFEGLTNDQKNQIKAETEAWMRFKKKERNAKQNFTNIKALPMPVQTKIPELLAKPFLKMIKDQLLK